MKIITRQRVRQKLEEYINRKISLNNLREWAENIIMTHREFNDWEGDDSFINEVITRIDMSDIDGFSEYKAKAISRLLESDKATKKLIKRLYKID